jgi:hypothetical protein
MLKRTATALVLAFVLAPQLPAQEPTAAEDDSAVVVVRGRVVHVAGLERGGKIIGKFARVSVRGQVFIVRCITPVAPTCAPLREGARVEVTGELSPTLIDALQVRRAS